jgi:hypothetical protein
MKRLLISLVAGICLVLATESCEEEVVTIGNEVIGGEPFTTGKAVYDVFAFNKNIEAVPTNRLPLYQLGVFNDPVYGRTEGRITSQLSLADNLGNPTFGRYTQLQENTDPDAIPENETITEVILYLPYFQNNRADRDADGLIDSLDADPEDPNSDTDGDGLTDAQERSRGTDPLNPDTDGDGISDGDDDATPQNIFAQRKDLDSIYGNREAPFNFKVERSTYFLRDLDPNSGFQEQEPYFSNQSFSPTFVSDVLFDESLTISDEEYLIFQEDDPDTEEDESILVDERIQPGIRVALDPQFFQQNFLDKEGSAELLSNANFREFFRGIHLSLTPIVDDLMILLDLTNARLTVNYEYDFESDGEIERREDDYQLRLLIGGQNQAFSGNAVNTLLNDAYPAEITDAFSSSENASRIYLKGGSGSFAEIELFDLLGGGDIINQIKQNNWIINEANLVFYVDRDRLDALGGTVEPPRLYLYNAETNQPLYNILTETNLADNPFGIFLNYDGFLEESSGKGIKYTVRLTEHINNIIIRDSANVTLGLTQTPDLRISGVNDVLLPDNSQRPLPASNAISPLGTVLIGSNVAADDPKKLKLEISYTEITQ